MSGSHLIFLLGHFLAIVFFFGDLVNGSSTRLCGLPARLASHLAVCSARTRRFPSIFVHARRQLGVDAVLESDRRGAEGAEVRSFFFEALVDGGWDGEGH